MQINLLVNLDKFPGFSAKNKRFLRKLGKKKIWKNPTKIMIFWGIPIRTAGPHFEAASFCHLQRKTWQSGLFHPTARKLSHWPSLECGIPASFATKTSNLLAYFKYSSQKGTVEFKTRAPARFFRETWEPTLEPFKWAVENLNWRNQPSEPNRRNRNCVLDFLEKYFWKN